MRIHILAALTIGSLLMLNGCTTATMGKSSSLQREIDDLRMEVSDLKASERLSDVRGGGGDPATELANLRTDVQRLSENMDATGQGGLSLKQQLDQINARLDRLDKQAGLATAAESRPASASSTGAYQPPSAVTAPAAPAQSMTAASTVPLPPTAIGPYENGKALFDKRQFREAIPQFKAYLKAEPKGSNADAAQYYIGESLFNQQKYEEAILEYQKVVQGFPKSNQVPNALFKQGISFQSIGDKDAAKLLYQKVVRDFPKNFNASMAKERLEQLKKGG